MQYSNFPERCQPPKKLPMQSNSARRTCLLTQHLQHLWLTTGQASSFSGALTEGPPAAQVGCIIVVVLCHLTQHHEPQPAPSYRPNQCHGAVAVNAVAQTQQPAPRYRSKIWLKATVVQQVPLLTAEPKQLTVTDTVARSEKSTSSTTMRCFASALRGAADEYRSGFRDATSAILRPAASVGYMNS